MKVIDPHPAGFPFAPRRLWESERHQVAARENRAVLIEVRERQDFAIREVIAGIDRSAAVEAVSLGVIVAPVEAEDRRTAGGAGQTQRTAQRRDEDEGIR